MLQDLWAADVQGKPFLTNVKDVAGAELSAQAMIRYFKPLQDWLVVQNVGRTAALPNL
jgi:hypothetical protein